MTKKAWNLQQWRVLGNWEPLMFLKRRGDGAFCDLDRLWADIHSDAAISRMKALGINLSHIHFHKGYGLEHEHESIEEARAWARKLHKHGIRVGAYIGCTVFVETFRHPHREQIIAKDGGVTWSRGQYFRRFWCYNSPQSRAYFEEVIDVAVKHIEADVLHFDAAFNTIRGQECRCEYCLAQFQTFIRDKLPEVIEAAGYSSAEHLQPPPLADDASANALNTIQEPGAVAWALYQAHVGLRALEHFTQYARSLRPDIAVLFNGATLCGIHPFCRSDRELAKLRLVDMTCVEDSQENPPGVTADGMPISRFRAYKAAARHATRVCYYTTEQGRDSALALAEAAAFNYASLGFVETAMQSNHRVETADARAMLDYIVDHETLFLDREPWHQIAVLRHQDSQMLNPFPSGLSPYVIEQLLFEEHAAFAILCEEDLDRRVLSEAFDLLILPDCTCLSDSEIREIEAFVQRGGALLSLGNTATATPINRLRPVWGFASIFDSGAPPVAVSAAYAEVAHALAPGDATPTSGAEPLQASFGRGRAVHIPRIDFDLPDKTRLHRFAGIDWYYHPYWRRPNNARQIVQSVDTLIGQRWRTQIELPRHVGVEHYRAGNEYRLQFINYAAEEVREGAVTFHKDVLPAGPAAVEWEAPSVPHERLRHATCVAGHWTVQLPRLDRLATLHVRF